MGISSRYDFHEDYLGSLPIGKTHDGATCFLMSQFILKKEARSAFSQQIASSLKPGGILVSSDLSGEMGTESSEALFGVWFNVISASDAAPEWINRMRAAYAKDVAMLPPAAVASIIASGALNRQCNSFSHGQFTDGLLNMLQVSTDSETLHR